MDPITITFYAIICGLLGVIAPSMSRPVTRLALGGFVGIAAAAALPFARTALGI